MSVSLIGIELEGRFLKAAKIRQGWRRSVLEDFFFADVPESGEEPEKWEKIRTDFHEWAGNVDASRVVATLPGDEAIPVRLRFPFGRYSKIEQVLKSEIENHVPLSVDGSVADFIPTEGKKGEGIDVIAVAAAKKTLSRQLEILATLDIVPDIVVYSPLAILRTVLTLAPSNGKGVLGVVHLGANYVSFSLCEAGQPTFIRTFRINRELDASGEGAGSGASLDITSLLRDLQFTLRACSQSLGRENPIGNLILSGDGVDLKMLAGQLEAGLGVSFRPVEWGEGIHAPTGGIPSPKNLWRGSCALGAALLHAGPFQKVLDLRREEFAPPQGWRELRRPIAVATIAAAIALGIGVADLSLKVRHAERRLKAAESSVQKVLGKVFPGGNLIVSPGPQITTRLRDRTRRLDVLVGNPALGQSALSLIARISAAVPSSVKLRLNQLSVDEGGITLKGVTRTFEAVDRVKVLLSQKGGFEKPEVKQARLLANRKGVEFFLFIPMSDKRNL